MEKVVSETRILRVETYSAGDQLGYSVRKFWRSEKDPVGRWLPGRGVWIRAGSHVVFVITSMRELLHECRLGQTAEMVFGEKRLTVGFTDQDGVLGIDIRHWWWDLETERWCPDSWRGIRLSVVLAQFVLDALGKLVSDDGD